MNSKIKKGLGRGLSSLIGETKVETKKNKLLLSELVPNKFQPRKNFDEENLTDLTNSIKERGVIQPIIVRKSSSDNSKFEIIGIRPGEKLHEQMIGIEDSYTTFEYKDYFKILPQINNWGTDKKRIKQGKKVKEGFIYSSENNIDWMTKTYFKNWIKANKEFVGKF